MEGLLAHGNHVNRQVSLLKPLSNPAMAENTASEWLPFRMEEANHAHKLTMW